MLLLLLALMWGSAFLMIKLAVVDFPPATIVAGRLLIAVALLFLFLKRQGLTLPRDWTLWRPFVIIGLAGNAIPFGLISWGEIRIDSSLAAVIIGTMPFYTVMLAHWMAGDEPLSPQKLAGVALGFAGLIVLVGPAALAGLGGAVIAQLAVALAAIFYAWTTVYARRLKGVPVAVTSVGALLAATLIALPVSLVVDRPWTLTPDITSASALLALAVFPTAVGTLIYFRLLATTSATFTSTVNYLTPTVGLAAGALALGEALDWTLALALMVILTGIWLINRSRRQSPGDTGSPHEPTLKGQA